MIAGWRVALRLARREVLRHRLRSALTAALVGAPVAALVVLATLVASSRITTAADAHRLVGQADYTMTSGQQQLLANMDLRPLIPASVVAVPDVVTNAVVTGSGQARILSQALGLDASSPVAAGIVHQDSGRPATAPGEVTVSSALARRLGLHVGADLTIAAQASDPGTAVAQTRARVVGIAHLPDDRNGFAIVGLPSTLAAVDTQASATWLVRAPAGFVLPASFTKALSSKGLQLNTQSYASRSRPVAASSVSDGVLIVGLALLIAALTAGSAFAVGARKQRRTLALIAVNGGYQPQLSRVVLASGVVLGAVGIVAAVPVGLVLSVIGYPILQDHVDRDLPGLHINVLWLVGACVFGAASALLAASIPARQAARTPVADGLGAARGATSTPRWVTGVGAVLALVGVLVTLLGATGSGLTTSERTPLVLLGSGLVQLGGVAICPVLIGAVGRLGRSLPAVSRIALRDSARQRARSGPAIAAVAAAVSGAMAVSIFAASINERDKNHYDAGLPRNVVEIQAQEDDHGVSPSLTSSDRTRALAGLDVVAEAPLVTVGQIGNDTNVIDPRAISRYGGLGLVADDGTLLTALTGAPQRAAEAALAQGEAVVPNSGLMFKGKVPLSLQGAGGADVSLAVPAVVVPWARGTFQPAAIISTALAKHLHLSPQNAGGWYVRLGNEPSLASLFDLQNVDQATGIDLSYETGYHRTWEAPLKAMLVLSALFSLLVTASAAALAGADSRADLASLGAVGASPGVRRRLAAAQAATTAVLGSGLGILIGLVPAYAVVIARSDVLPFTVPWQPFPVFLVGLPGLAALGGLAFTRSHLPKPARVR